MFSGLGGGFEISGRGAEQSPAVPSFSVNQAKYCARGEKAVRSLASTFI
jgi:hypothetical protein